MIKTKNKIKLKTNQNHINVDVVIMGGVGFTYFDSEDDFEFIEPTPQPIDTGFGKVIANICEIKEKTVAIISRHAGIVKHIPPHKINYLANMKAAWMLGANYVISTNSVGTMKGHKIGSFFIPSDFIDFTKLRISTFYNEDAIHVDMTEPYCNTIRKNMFDTLKSFDIEHSEGIYICTEGPRFETKAEINMMKQFGDVIGMTGVPEVILAKELEMCYASICTVTNDACGLSTGKLTTTEVIDTLKFNNENLYKVLIDVISKIPDAQECDCVNSIMHAQM